MIFSGHLRVWSRMASTISRSIRVGAMAILATSIPSVAPARDAAPSFTAGWDGFVIQANNGDFKLQFGILAFAGDSNAPRDRENAILFRAQLAF